MTRRGAGAASGILVLIIAGSSACSSSEKRQGGVTLRDSAGVRITENDAPVWGAGQGWQLGEATLDFGGTSESDILTYVQRAIRLANGNVVLTNVEPREWRLYDST